MNNNIIYSANTTLTLKDPDVITLTPSTSTITNIGIALYNKETGEYKSNIKVDDISMLLKLHPDDIDPEWDDEEIQAYAYVDGYDICVYWY